MIPHRHQQGSTAAVSPASVSDSTIPLTRPKTLGPLRTPAATLLDRAMAAADVSQRQVAAALGVSRGLVARWCLDGSMPLSRLLALRARLPKLFAQVVALLDEAAAPSLPVAPMVGVLNVTTETGELARAVADALADGVVDEAEQKRIDKEAADVQVAAGRLRVTR